MDLGLVLRGVVFAVAIGGFVFFVRFLLDHNDRPPEPEGE